MPFEGVAHNVRGNEEFSYQLPEKSLGMFIDQLLKGKINKNPIINPIM